MRDLLGATHASTRSLVRSATSIGANVEEAKVANSDPLVNDVEPLIKEANEWVAMLTTTVKKLRS